MDFPCNIYPCVVSLKENLLVLRVFVQPNATKTLIVGLHEDALKIRLRAQAIENKANKEVCEFIASFFGVKKRAVTLTHGLQSRVKLLSIEGDTIEFLKKLSSII